MNEIFTNKDFLSCFSIWVLSLLLLLFFKIPACSCQCKSCKHNEMQIRQSDVLIAGTNVVYHLGKTMTNTYNRIIHISAQPQRKEDK